MSYQSVSYRIRQLFSTLAAVEEENPILLEGEVWIEKHATTGESTGRRKVGRGAVVNGEITGPAFVDLPFEPSGAGAGVTDLSVTGRTSTGLTVASSTGTDAALPAATNTEAGLATAAQVAKLEGIAAGATANATDAQLRDRSTHTGTQAAGTITGLATVATSGAYGDLSGRPTLGGAAALNVGTTAGTVAAGDDARLSDARTPTTHTQAASTISDSTVAGRALLTAADAAAQRIALELGTAATTASTAYATAAQGAKADAAASVGLAAGLAIALG